MHAYRKMHFTCMLYLNCTKLKQYTFTQHSSSFVQDVHMRQNEVPWYPSETAADTAEAGIQQCTSFSPNASEQFNFCSRQDVPTVEITSGLGAELNSLLTTVAQSQVCNDTCSTTIFRPVLELQSVGMTLNKRVHVMCSIKLTEETREVK